MEDWNAKTAWSVELDGHVKLIVSTTCEIPAAELNDDHTTVRQKLLAALGSCVVGDTLTKITDGLMGSLKEMQARRKNKRPVDADEESTPTASPSRMCDVCSHCRATFAPNFLDYTVIGPRPDTSNRMPERLLCKRCRTCTACKKLSVELYMLCCEDGKLRCQDCVFFCSACAKVMETEQWNITLSNDDDLCATHCCSCHEASGVDALTHPENGRVYCKPCVNAKNWVHGSDADGMENRHEADSPIACPTSFSD